VVGNHPSLGDWNVDKALQLEWHDNDVWAAEAKVPVGKKIEFKVNYACWQVLSVQKLCSWVLVCSCACC
jgi:hypothetical protein